MAEYVAKEDLYIGFTKARNKGDVIDGELVERFGWKDQVETKKTADKKAADDKKDDSK